MLQSYSHSLSHITTMFNYIMQVVKQQGSDNTEGQDDYGMTKPANQAKLHTLVWANQLSLITIDEADLFTEWSEFCTAVSDLRNIKSHFPSISIMCLTATANPAVEEDIKLCFGTQLYKRCP